MADTDPLDQPHRRIRDLLREARRLPPAGENITGDELRRRQTLLRQLGREFIQHVSTTEAQLWPRLDEKVVARIYEHKDVAECNLLKTQWVGDRDERVNEMVDCFIASVDRALRDERRGLNAANISEADRRDLAEKLQRLRRYAPTRPHPDMPKGRVPAQLLGPLTALVDRVRDAMEPRPTGA